MIQCPDRSHRRPAHEIICQAATRLVRPIAPAVMLAVHAALANAPALALSAPVGSTPAAAQAAGPAADTRELIRRFATDRDGLRRFYELPWSEARLDRLDELHRAWRERLDAVDFDALAPSGRVDWLLLRDFVRGEGERIALERRRLAEMEELLPFRRTIQRLERERWAMGPLDVRAAAAEIAEIKPQLDALRTRLEAGMKAKPEAAPGAPASAPPPANEPSAAPKESKTDAASSDTPVRPLKVSPVVAQRAASAADGIRGTLRVWHDFHAGYRPEFSWWLKKPFEDATTAIQEHAKFLREEVAGLKGKDADPLIGDPIGIEALNADLRREAMPYSAEELIAIGERELAWCEAEMKKAAAEMGLGEDWKAALERVKALHQEPGGQDELVAAQAREAIEFLAARDMITIPPLALETWRLTMLSPETQKILPFAAYGGQAMLVAYPTDAMAHADKIMSMRGNNRHFTRIVTAHELIPGHHLQAFMAERERPERRLFSTPFFVEGWALYWEMLLWDEGFARSPEDRVGMLFWRMHRCARIVVSLKFHLGRMTPAQMVNFLVERVGHERFGATSEVRRYVGELYSPLYQAAYMVGGLQLRALRREVVDAGRMTPKQFHDALLTLGPIPIEYVRAELLGEPLPRDFEARWRFDR